MTGRLMQWIAGRWFDAWSARAAERSRVWARRSDRWRCRAEKFFHKVNGGGW